MELMTKELEVRFNEIGSQQFTQAPIVIAKYFNPAGSGTWYATEYDLIKKLFLRLRFYFWLYE